MRCWLESAGTGEGRVCLSVCLMVNCHFGDVLSLSLGVKANV